MRRGADTQRDRDNTHRRARPTYISLRLRLTRNVSLTTVVLDYYPVRGLSSTAVAVASAVLSLRIPIVVFIILFIVRALSAAGSL